MAVLKAVVFDWAGTLIDFGSRAPVLSFVAAFARFGVAVSEAEARAPMGKGKRDHIRAMLAMPGVAACWQAAHGAPPGEPEAQSIFAAFEPAMAEMVAAHATAIPGAAAAMADARARGLKVATTTGYTRAIMARVMPLAAAQGLVPDAIVCAGDMAEDRPAPLGMDRLMADLGVWPAATVLKVDDTAPGIGEGRNAGCVTVGLALSGNAVGLTLDALSALPLPEVARLRADATAALRAAGADHVIDSVADLPALIARLAQA